MTTPKTSLQLCCKSFGRLGRRLFCQPDQVVVAVEPGAMTVAKVKTKGVVTDLLPAQHLNPGKMLLVGAAVLLAEDVLFAACLGTGGSSAEFFHRVKRFRTVAPGNRDFLADKLDVSRCFHDSGSGTSGCSFARGSFRRLQPVTRIDG